MQKLTGPGAAFERTGTWLLSEALWPRELGKVYTRTQLKGLDDAVVKAANALRKALDQHPDFSQESAAANWPEEEAVRIATALRGLSKRHAVNQLWPGKDQHVAMQDAFFDGVFRRVPDAWTSNRLRDGLYFLVAELSPTMGKMAGVLAQRATAQSSARLESRKTKTNRQAIETYFIRHQVFSFILRNPRATPDRAARIISPIVVKSIGAPLEAKKTLAKCKRIAQGIVDEIGDREGKQRRKPSTKNELDPYKLTDREPEWLAAGSAKSIAEHRRKTRELCGAASSDKKPDDSIKN